MAQEQERVGGNQPGFGTGVICTDTSLYTTTDNKMEYIEHVPAGAAFPNFPGGNGKGKCVWFKLTLATDGHRTKFDADKTRS